MNRRTTDAWVHWSLAAVALAFVAGFGIAFAWFVVILWPAWAVASAMLIVISCNCLIKHITSAKMIPYRKSLQSYTPKI